MKIIAEDRTLGLKLCRIDAESGDSSYAVIVSDGEVIYTTRVKAAAVVVFEDRREEMWQARPDPSPEERLRRESEHRDLQAVRSDAFDRRTKNTRPRGGRGGRGGV